MNWGHLGGCFTSGQPIGGDCEAMPTNVIRYDSPTFAGFSMSADWGQNGGYWDVYGRYSGEYNGIKSRPPAAGLTTTRPAVLQIVPGPVSVGDGQLNGGLPV